MYTAAGLTIFTRWLRESCGLISEHSTIAPELIMGLWGLPEREGSRRKWGVGVTEKRKGRRWRDEEIGIAYLQN